MSTKKHDADLTYYLKKGTPQRHPIVYFILGYGRAYIGQSMQGKMRMTSSLAERLWGNKFLWIDLNSATEFVSNHRKLLEALLINGMSASREKPLSNVQYCKSLKKFETACTPMLARIVSKITALIYSFELQNPDVRGNYFDDAATVMRGADAVGHDVWLAVCKRLDRNNGGASRGFISAYQLDLAAILKEEKP